jgi:hypothetical protein
MNIEELTIKQIKEIQSIFPSLPTQTTHPLLNKNVIVRTVTMIYTGRLDHVTQQDYVLLDCSWIPETDRYAQFVENGSVRECEPFPSDLPVYINRGALLDVCELRKSLPRSQR